MSVDLARILKYDILSELQTAYEEHDLLRHINNLSQLDKNFSQIEWSEASNDFVSDCKKYFTDIVIPHKQHVANAGLDLIESKIFVEYGIDKKAFANRLVHHDLSKFSYIEASGYVHKHFGQIDFRSQEFKLAWHHHKAHNDHHAQYWYDIDSKGKLSCLDMSPIAIFEMFADFIGAGMTYGKTFEEWFPKNCQNFILSELTAKIVSHIAASLLDRQVTCHRHEKIAGMYVKC